MFSITVNADALKALAITASTCPTRPALVGVCIDTTVSGRVNLVSTDGHRMTVVNVPTWEGDAAPGRYILPLFDVKNAKPARKGEPVTVDILPGNPGRFTIKGKSEVTGTLVDSQFAEWRRVCPASPSGELAHYDMNYLGDFGRIATLLGRKYAVIQHNGQGPALINLGADAFGILMPIRTDHVDKIATPPDWIAAPVVEVAKAA